MKFIEVVSAAVMLLSFADAAQAQFSQPPPPSTPAPTCSHPKSTAFPLLEGSDCRVKNLLPNLLGNTSTTLDCTVNNGVVACITSTDIYENGQWSTLDPSTLTHYWAYVLDGQENYMAPDNSDSFYVDCGFTRTGYVRVTAGGSTAQVSFLCPTRSSNR
jgi:hypothetical protein